MSLFASAYPGEDLARCGLSRFAALIDRLPTVRDRLYSPYSREVQEAEDADAAGRQAEFYRLFPALSGMWPDPP